MPQSRVFECLLEHMLGRCRMAELAHSASSSDDPYVPLFPSDVEGVELQVGPTDEEPVLKRCGTCKNYKPLDDFWQNASRRDGRQHSCKACVNHGRRKERKERSDDAEEDENAPHDEEPPQKRSRGDDLYVFKNSRLPEYKIGRSSDIAARCQALQRSQNFYIQRVATFEGKGHLEDTVREMLAYCLLPREVAAGTEWHTCSLQTALAAIGQAIDRENAQQSRHP